MRPDPRWSSHTQPDNPKEAHIIRLAVALERTKELPTRRLADLLFKT